MIHRLLLGAGAPMVGLDIGRRSVCAVALQRTPTGVAVAGVGVAPCQPFFDSNGIIANTAQTAAAAAKALAAAGIAGKRGLCVGMPARASAIVSCQLPERLPARMRKDAATYAAASSLGVSPRDVRITALRDLGGGRWHASVANPRLEANREKLVSQMRNGCWISAFEGEPSALHRAMLNARPSIPVGTRLRAFLDARVTPAHLIVFDAVDGVWPLEGTSAAPQLLEIITPSQATRQVVVHVGYRLGVADAELSERGNIDLYPLSQIMPKADDEHRDALLAFGLALYAPKADESRQVDAGPFAVIVPARPLPTPPASLPPVPADLAHLGPKLEPALQPAPAPTPAAAAATPVSTRQPPEFTSSPPLASLLADDDDADETQPVTQAQPGAPLPEGDGQLRPLLEEEEDENQVAPVPQPSASALGMPATRPNLNGLAGEYIDDDERAIRARVGWTYEFLGDAATTATQRLALLGDLTAALASPQEPFVSEALIGGYPSEPNPRVRVAMLELLCALPTTSAAFLWAVAHAPSSAERVHALSTLIRREDHLAPREGLRDEDESVAVRVAVEVYRRFGQDELEHELDMMTDAQRVTLLRSRVAELTAAGAS